MNKLLLILYLFCSLSIKAQDLIHFKDGNVKEVKLVQISDEEVQYYMWNNQDGPLFINRIDKITFVKFKNGEVERFESNISTPDKSTQAAESISSDVFDLLYLSNGEVVKGKVEAVTPSSVSIRRVNLPSKPKISYKKADLEKIVYSDGTEDQFIQFKQKEKEIADMEMAQQEYLDHTIRWNGGETFRTKQKNYNGKEVLSVMEGSKENIRLINEGFNYYSDARSRQILGGIILLAGAGITVYSGINDETTDLRPAVVTPMLIGIVGGILVINNSNKLMKKGNDSIKSAVDSHNAKLKEKITYELGGSSNGLGLVVRF